MISGSCTLNKYLIAIKMYKPHVFISRIIPDAGVDMLRNVADLDIWEKEEPPPYEVYLKRVKKYRRHFMSFNRQYRR